MKILLTGGTGWLGRKLVTALEASGHELCLLVRPTSKIDSPLQAIVLGDNDEAKIVRYAPEAIIHTACVYYRKGTRLDDIVEANFRLPAWLLRIASEIGCRRFFSIGSNLPETLSYYTFTKAMLSDIGRMFVEKGLLSFTEILPEAFYDVDEPANRFLPRCISQMRANEPVLLPEGHRHRDYMLAADLVDIITFVLDKDFSAVAEFKHDDCTYTKIQVGSGEAPSVRSFMEFIKKLLHSDSELCYGAIPPRPNEPDSIADLSVLKSLGYDIEKIAPWTTGIYSLIMDATSTN